MEAANPSLYGNNYDRKMFYSVGPGSQYYKTYTSSLTKRKNSLECWSQENLSSASLYFPWLFPQISDYTVKVFQGQTLFVRDQEKKVS
jgi:hypothetical protein